MATQKGLPVLVIIVAIAAALGGGYYLLSTGQIPGAPSIPSIPGISTVPRATEKDFVFIDDPLVRKHFAAQANVTSFRSKTHDLIGIAGSFNVFEVQMKGNDAFFYNWHESDGTKGGELITIGDTTYIKDYKDGQWWKQTVKPEEKPKNKDEGAREPENFTDYTEDRKLTYKKLGEETCGPFQCYQYEEYDPQSPEEKRIFWFDKQKLLLRKEESGFGEWRGTTEYEYDAINIQPPTPTKDVPTGRNIYEYMGTGAPVNLPIEVPQGAPNDEGY